MTVQLRSWPAIDLKLLRCSWRIEAASCQEAVAILGSVGFAAASRSAPRPGHSAMAHLAAPAPAWLATTTGSPAATPGRSSPAHLRSNGRKGPRGGR